MINDDENCDKTRVDESNDEAVSFSLSHSHSHSHSSQWIGYILVPTKLPSILRTKIIFFFFRNLITTCAFDWAINIRIRMCVFIQRIVGRKYCCIYWLRELDCRIALIYCVSHLFRWYCISFDHYCSFGSFILYIFFASHLIAL